MGCNWSNAEKNKDLQNENVEKISKTHSNVRNITVVSKKNGQTDQDSHEVENNSAKGTNGVTPKNSFLGTGHNNAKVSPMVDKGKF